VERGKMIGIIYTMLDARKNDYFLL